MQATGAGAEQTPAPPHVCGPMLDLRSVEQVGVAGHATGVGVEQAPAPLQVLAGMRDSPSPEQVAAPQRTAAGIEQTPAPLQVLAGMRDRRSAEQVAAPQGTAAGRVHIPVPLHMPAPILDVPSIEHVSAPQASPAWVSQAVPFARHLAVVPHIWSAQVVAQQTLFMPAPVAVTQLLLAQSLPAVHVEPSASGVLHSLPMHVKPAAQGAVAEQLVAQTPAVHR